MSVNRNTRTLQIEARIKEGHPISAIAREFGCDRRWVQQVRARLRTDYQCVTATSHMRDVAEPSTPVSVIPSHSPMKLLTITITPAVHDALVEACAISNRQSPEDPISLTEYVEDITINKLVELGLLRKRR